MRRLLVVVPLVLLGACGQAPPDEDAAAPGGTPSPTGSPAPDPDPAAPTGLVAEADDTWTPWGKGTTPTDLSDEDAAGFTAASGAITCVLDPVEPGHGDAQVVCDRREGLGVDQPRPRDCAPDAWGDTVAASRTGGGVLVCRDGPVADALSRTPARVLADSGSATYDGITCAVRGEAVQCLGDRARGFVVSPRVIVVR